MDPYKILGIDKDASKDEIRRAYRKQAAKYHPDSGGDAWIFQEIQDAYDELTGKKKKKKKPKDSASAKQAPPTGANDPFQESPFGNGPFEFDIPDPEPSQGHTFGHTYKPHGFQKRKKKKSDARKLTWVTGGVGGIALMTILMIFLLPYLYRSISELVVAKENSDGFVKSEQVSIPVKPIINRKKDVPKQLSKPERQNLMLGTASKKENNKIEIAETGLSEPVTKPTTEPTISLPHPVLALTFDNTGNSVAGPNVEVSGGANTVGYVGNSLTLKSSSYAKTSKMFPTGGSSRTLAVWLKSNHSGVFRNVHVIHYGQPQSKASFGLMIARNKWSFFDWDGGLDSGKVIDTDWHHHCITYDGNELIYYLDGEAVARGTHQLQTKQGPLILGKRGKGYPSGFEGQIDELMVYSSALSNRQIDKLVSRGREGKHPVQARSSRSVAASKPKGNFGTRQPNQPSVGVRSPQRPNRPGNRIGSENDTQRKLATNRKRTAIELRLQLRGTKWMNSNSVTFEWTADGKLLHNGTEREWKVVNGDRVQIVFSYNHVDTLVFDASKKNFRQLIRGGPESFTGRLITDR